MKRVPWWVWISVLACAGAAGFSVSERHKVEAANNKVGLMMEMSDIEAIAAAVGRDRYSTLRELQTHGLTGVAITEDTIGDLARKGRIVIETDGSSLQLRAVGDLGSRWVRPGTPDQQYLGSQFQRDLYHLDRVASALASRGFFDLGTVNVPYGSRYPTSISVDRDAVVDISSIPVGIDPRAAYESTEAGLVVVARQFNEVGANAAVIVRSLREARDAGATAYLIGGDQALGNRNLLDATAQTLSTLQIAYLSPEFVSLGGDAQLRSKLRTQAFRLHSISQTEAETMSPREVEERFAKAYRERSVRWLLLRPTSRAGNNVLDQASAMLIGVREAVEDAGGEVAPPVPFQDPDVSVWVVRAIAALSLPAVLWTILTTLGRNWLSYIAAFVGLAVLAGAFVDEGIEFAALLISIAMPVLGYLAVSAMKRGRWFPFLGFLLMSAVSLVGGLAVAGMMVGIEYTLRISAFTGVKVSMFLPILLVGWVMLREQGSVGETMRKPVTWVAASVTILGLVVIALLALRSGNENPSAVSSMELQVRSLLDNLLHVRPRSKEVALGHPALVVALCLMAFRPGLSGWASLLLLAGMVGQTSIVNTLCHLHTPVLLSLARIGVGVALGGIIGALVWAFARRLLPAEETTQ